MPARSIESAEVTFLPGDVPFEIMRGTFRRQHFAPHAHDTYAIGMMERGAARVVFEGDEVLHTAGDVVTIAPGEVHTGAPADHEGWSYRMMYVPCELMARFSVDGLPPAFKTSGVHDPALGERIAAAHRVLESAAPIGLKLTALARAMELLCEKHGVQRRDSTPDARYQRMLTVRCFLASHLAERVTLAQLASLAGIGAFHLIREFRRAFGIPPYTYLELLRVTRARTMLMDGDRISDVAFSTGFSDQAHLTRRFKRVFGVTPGRYARSYRSFRQAAAR